MNELILSVLVIVPTIVASVYWLSRPVDAPVVTPPADLPVILFKDGVLHHASEKALALLPIDIGAHTWADLREILLPRFPNFPEQLNGKRDGSLTVRRALEGAAEAEYIDIHWLARGARLEFHGPEQLIEPSADRHELETLREITECLEDPIWKTDTDGDLVWRNEAYAALAKRVPHGAASQTKPIFMLNDPSEGQTTGRASLTLTGSDTPEWFYISQQSAQDGTIFHASSLTALITAENARRDFIQTLAKTFAHLSIGLAIFNRDRQLAMFNPALCDLTGLCPSFLSARPTINSLFDALRENRRMPEPKNYSTWRQRMADLISAAEIGRFEETWTLETGQTYRVKGRPHPDGAIAFLVEDISAEISLTRNFRAELELGQSLADTFEDAVAVFSQTGILTFSNKAYDLLWGFQGDSSFADVTITDAVKMWREKSSPNPMWQDLQEHVLTLGERAPLELPVRMTGQSPMHCKVVPIASGATAIRFTLQSKAAPDRAEKIEKSLR